MDPSGHWSTHERLQDPSPDTGTQGDRQHQFKTMMCCKVFITDGYRLRLQEGEVDGQAPKPVPTFTFKGPTGADTFMDGLAWGGIRNCFHSYVIAVLQALLKLHQLYTINDYGKHLRSNNVETMNNQMWTNCVQVPHRTDHSKALHPSLQAVFFDKDFEAWKQPMRKAKKCRVDKDK